MRLVQTVRLSPSLPTASVPRVDLALRCLLSLNPLCSQPKTFIHGRTDIHGTRTGSTNINFIHLTLITPALVSVSMCLSLPPGRKNGSRSLGFLLLPCLRSSVACVSLSQRTPPCVSRKRGGTGTRRGLSVWRPWPRRECFSASSTPEATQRGQEISLCPDSTMIG